MGRMSPYADTIRETSAALGHVGINPAHVEAWMRSEHPTLDALPPAAFRREVAAAIDCVLASDAATNDGLARCEGLL